MWIYKDKEINSIADLPENIYGFIYLITNLTNGMQYIGKKNIFSERTVALGKKELAALTDKRKSKKKKVKKESDWLSYTGSCIELNQHIAEGHKIKKEILELCFSKRSLTYQEVKYLFINEVLEQEKYYNMNINKMWFKGNLV